MSTIACMNVMVSAVVNNHLVKDNSTEFIYRIGHNAFDSQGTGINWSYHSGTLRVSSTLLPRVTSPMAKVYPTVSHIYYA